MTDYFSIHFSDLKNETQKLLSEFMGIRDPSELNWDVFPIFQLPRKRTRSDNTKSEQRYHNLPRGCIWDIDDDDFAYEI